MTEKHHRTEPSVGYSKAARKENIGDGPIHQDNFKPSKQKGDTFKAIFS